MASCKTDGEQDSTEVIENPMGWYLGLIACSASFKREILKLLTPPPFPADIEDEEDTGTTVLTARATFSEIRYCDNIMGVAWVYCVSTANDVYYPIRIIYTGGWNVWGGWFLAGNQGNFQNFVPSSISKNLWRIFIEMKQKKFFFEKKNAKWPTKKRVFQNRQFSIFFFKNFMDWSLG